MENYCTSFLVPLLPAAKLTFRDKLNKRIVLGEYGIGTKANPHVFLPFDPLSKLQVYYHPSVFIVESFLSHVNNIYIYM